MKNKRPTHAVMTVFDLEDYNDLVAEAEREERSISGQIRYIVKQYITPVSFE